jgi:hypothetical protein
MVKNATLESKIYLLTLFFSLCFILLFYFNVFLFRSFTIKKVKNGEKSEN